MKNILKNIIKCRMPALLLLLVAVMAVFSTTAYADGEKQELTIIFTHDLHSHLDPLEQEEGEIGGFARIKTKIDEIRAEGNTTFLLDAGDFSMGTLYQVVYETQAAELVMLGRMGFDATTFGNHEFDYRAEGVTNMLNSAVRIAKAENIALPAFLCANIDWSKNTSDEAVRLKEAYDNYGGGAYTIIERDGIRAGIFGLMGKDSESCAPESGLVFEDTIATAKDIVAQLKDENVDIIICLSHSGTWEDINKSEDEQLAMAVPEIDIIISGHTHTTLAEPIVYENTYIISSGCYGTKLGSITVLPDGNGRWVVDEYTLYPMDESVDKDETVTQQLSVYKELVGEDYLNRFGYEFDEVLAYSTFAFTSKDEFASEHREDTLGNLISDSYMYAVKQAEGAAYETVDVAIVGSGVVRASFGAGDITVSDVFDVSSLGIGADRIAGYPLVSAYLTGKELKIVAELDASLSPLMPTVQLYPSGMIWSLNEHRIILNKVFDVSLVRGMDESTGEWIIEEIEDDKLYRVVTGLYSLQMLGAVEKQSYGLISLVPKDKNGNPVTDYESCIIYNLSTGEEVKEWVALATYLTSFEKNENGVSQIPQKYSALEGRKTVNDNWNFIELIKNPNIYFFAIIGIVIVAIVLIVLIIWLIVKITKKIILSIKVKN